MQMILTAPLQQAAAGANADATVTVAAPGTWQIVKAYFAPNVAAAAHATNYGTVTLSTNQAAAGSFTACATALTTASVAMAVATPRELVLLTTAAGIAAQYVPQGGSIKLAKTYAGSGVAIEGQAVIVVQKVPEA